MPMDREYGNVEIAHHGDEANPGNQSTNDVGVGIKDIGFSLGLGPVPNVPAIGAKLRAGAKTAELTFMGAGKGSGQAHTPEYYGKMQRKALAEIRAANEVNFTTHASVGVQGLAGMDRQGNFSKESKNFSLHEIKRAIEFAADVAAGGPIVVHTGEFIRPLSGADWNQKGDYKEKFKLYEDEEQRETYGVVDDRTGHVIQEAKKNRKVSRPIWKRAEKDIPEKGVRKGDYVDYWDNKINRAERVPVFESGEFKTKQYGWPELTEEAKEMTAEAKEDFRKWKQASPEEKKKIESRSLWARFLKPSIVEEEISVRPEEAYIVATLETQAGNARGWALQYSRGFEDEVESVRRFKSALKVYERMEKATVPEEKQGLILQVAELLGKKKELKELHEIFQQIERTENNQEKQMLAMQARKLLTEIIPENAGEIQKGINQLDSAIKQSREGASAYFAQAEEAMETIKHVQSSETYALQEAYDAYAQAGMFAMEQTKKLGSKARKPLAVAMENLFPEGYGAHPDEIINLVQKSRERMAEMLTRKGLSDSEARQRAEQHITATIDTGHLNMWRKYWTGDQKKTVEQNEKDFENWAVNKMAEMAKAKVVGHVHLVDNFGYQDDHLAPGEGNTPIKKMVKALKDNGYKGELIVEPGADWSTDVSGFHSVMKAWKLFGNPVYGSGTGAGVGMGGWGEVGYRSLGRNQPPYFVFGPYAPSEEWTLWSNVPLE